MSEVIIRPLRAADYDATISLWRESGLPYFSQGRDSKDEIIRQLSLPTSIFLVAEFDGKIVGVILGTHDGRKGWINRLAVSPHSCPVGVARRLLEAVEKRFSQLGIGIFSCLIEGWNARSMKFFRSAGYEKCEDIIYFRKKLNPNV